MNLRKNLVFQYVLADLLGVMALLFWLVGSGDGWNVVLGLFALPVSVALNFSLAMVQRRSDGSSKPYSFHIGLLVALSISAILTFSASMGLGDAKPYMTDHGLGHVIAFIAATGMSVVALIVGIALFLRIKFASRH